MFAFVGCRTTRERNARGEGISVYAIARDGGWSLRSVLRGLINPSYLALNGRGDRLYTVHGDGEAVSAFALSVDGSLSPLGTQPTGGRNPVHLCVHEASSALLVANYATGSVARLPILADGRLGPLAQRLDLPGEVGPHRTQQQGSHPHQILADPSGARIIVPDKGLDRVFTIGIGPDDGRLALVPDAPPGREGAGPRHAVFAPDGTTLFVANELDATVTRFRYAPDTGMLAAQEIVSVLPADCLRTSHAAGIVLSPCGRWLYVSNRGDDSITQLEVDPATSRLRPRTWTKTGGAKPRFLTLDPTGRMLVVANEDSDTIVFFALDRGTGALAPTGQVVETGSPVCIVFGGPAQRGPTP